MTEEEILEYARKHCKNSADILSQLLSRYASHKAKDSAFADQRALLWTIAEIAELRQKKENALNAVDSMALQIADLKVRNLKLLSQLQEYEAREY